MSRPLADRIRPRTLDEMVGQRHLLGPGMALRNIVESGNIPNLIFYGPSGVGKTTLANIIAEKTSKKLYRLNATTSGIADIKADKGLNDSRLFNLAGQQVSKNYKGVVIMNGKKLINK